MKNYLQLKQNFERLAHLHYVQRIMMWDEATMMPEGAGAYRANALSTLNGLIQKMLATKKNKKLIDLALQENLTGWDKINLEWINKKYVRATCIPLKLTEKMTHAGIVSEQAWRKLRPQNNWREFLPYLKKTFKLVREIAERKSQTLAMDPYQAMLDEYVPGFTQDDIQKVFTGLKNILPRLINEITERQNKCVATEPSGPFAIEKQKAVALKIMQALQFDFNHGRLDVSHHPFCGGEVNDVRITTRYTDKEFISSLFGVCHETGHALYEQGLPKEWITQPIGHVENMAMHESQSLLVEMEVCRSAAFIEYLVPLLHEQFGQQDALTAENLFKLVTRVKPSLIRVDADEVTYPLHVILRYEIEQALFKDEIAVKDLPGYWNELMVKYLGISTLGNDKNGVMQDVHWPAGAFGYFPGYTLGRMIAAQIFATFLKSHPDFFREVKQGNFLSLKNWLNKNVHGYASSLSTHELLAKVTHEPLNPNYFIERIRERYLEQSGPTQ